MPASKIDTFEEYLPKILRVVQDGKMVANADEAWLVNIETMILQKIREPEQQMAQQGLIPSASQNPQGAAQMGFPGGAVPMGAGGPVGSNTGGLMSNPAPMNPDELRRVLSVPQ